MQLEVVTPTGTAVKTNADEVIAPGVEGEFGVLPGHSPFMTAMKPGVLRYRVGGTLETIAVGPGLVEVPGLDDDRVIVLADRTAKVDEIDVAAARRELDEAEQAQKANEPGAVEKRDWAQARIDATTRK